MSSVKSVHVSWIRIAASSKKRAAFSHQYCQRKRKRLDCQAKFQTDEQSDKAASSGTSSKGMEALLQQHATRILHKASSLNHPAKYLVAIAGAPGSGKTATAHAMCRILNSHAGAKADLPIATVASMDGFFYPFSRLPPAGFHYYRSELDAMPDPTVAHARRGAHWTFNAQAFVTAVQQLKTKSEALLPSFDHAMGDPVEDDVIIAPHHRIVLIEGNYVLLREEPWNQLKDLVDESWFISCPLNTAMDRVIERQVGNGSDLETARWRVANNDRPNAELIQLSCDRASHIIVSQPYKDRTYLRP